VVASSGIKLGQGIPNVGVRVQLPEIADPDTAPGGVCAGRGGYVLTNADGIAECDLVLNTNVGTGSILASVGNMVLTRPMDLQITPGQACTITLASSTRTFAAAAGNGTITVTAPQGCTWTATSVADWISITAGASGVGNGTVAFSVANNAGAARTGTIAVGNQSISITQNAAGTSGGPLAFTVAAALPGAIAGTSYSYALAVSGGTPPYTWAATTVPPGLTLNGTTGLLSGVPATAGSFTIPVTARDAAGGSASRSFTLVVAAAPAPGTITFVTTSFPNGVVGVQYSTPVSVAGGCQNPFAGPVRITVDSGALPPGLELRSAVVQGTPTTAGNYSFTLRAADLCGASTTRNFTLAISATAGSGGEIQASAASVEFSAAAGGTSPLEKTLTISSGTTPMSFTAAAE
jgi:hypothetical protein